MLLAAAPVVVRSIATIYLILAARAEGMSSCRICEFDNMRIKASMDS
ncbi:MAG: hypothetical protein RMJ00_07375 [Nitrososphaerota archaeon]|nr:hypothetical protein [Candidatus Bathyarchaeota archaeon]MCX8162351.1 hypothetical protein [Candidatus Bathyarchaeota archaeon]MDW8062499.1 hypothetical protein [Nitrososphaerota archaeon]